MKNITRPRPISLKQMLAVLPLGVVFVPNAYAADDECYYSSFYAAFLTCVDSYTKLDSLIHSNINITEPYQQLTIGGGAPRLGVVNIELAPDITVTSVDSGIVALGPNEINVTTYGNVFSGSTTDVDGYDPQEPIPGPSGGMIYDDTSIRRTEQASIYFTGGSGGLAGLTNLMQYADSQIVNRSGSKDTAAIYSMAIEAHVTTSGVIRSYVGDGVRFEGAGPEYIYDENNGSGGYVVIDMIDGNSIFDVHALSGSIIEGGSEGAGIRTTGGGVSTITIDNGATLGALSDIAISADGYKAYYSEDGETVDTYSFKGATTSLTNSGTMTGVIQLSSGKDTVVNETTGVWNVRQFADTNRDGIRDTVANVATSEFGGGTTSLLNRGQILLAANDDGTANSALFSNLTSFENQGLLSLSNTVVGDRFTIDGDYIGANGIISLDTRLGDDLSATDMLVVNGDTSGSSLVQVTNIGDSGAQTVEGIKIIDVLGASNGAFSLIGDYIYDGDQAVVGGAYAYRLYQGDKSGTETDDWYLRSELKQDSEPNPPHYQSGVPVYEAYPQALLGLNGLNTFQQRVGNRVWAGKGNRVISEGADALQPYAAPEEAGIQINGNGVWGRIEGAHNHIEPRFSTSSTDYKQNVFKIQAGIDGLLSENESGRLIGSAFGQYVHGKTKVASVHGDGEISTDGYGLGGALTWHGNEGFYVDSQAQLTWYNSDLDSTLANRSLVHSNKGFGYALSVESGKRFAINQEWSVTPQAQLVYSSIKFDDFTDVFDAAVSLDKGASLQSRLGVTLDHETSWQNANGLTNRSHIYGITDLYYEFLNGTKVDVAGVSFASQKDRVWGGLGFGGSYNWDNDKYSFYGETIVNTSLNNFGDSYSVKGNVGFRMKW